MATELATVRSSERGQTKLPLQAAPPLAVGIGVAAIAAAQGGYFPTSWGWAALALFWAAGIALVFAAHIELSRLELAFLGLLAALVGWTALSLAWTSSVAQSVDEIERSLVYLAGATAFLLVARRATVGTLLGAVLVALTGISAYALATRLFPKVLSASQFGGYRLSTPIGYWNGLGLVAGMAALLALGFVASERHVVERALAAAVLPVLLVTLYFTYSRGAWVALAAGFAVAVAVDHRRLRLITTALVLVVPVALPVWLASRSKALTHLGSSLGSSVSQGHRLFAWLVVFAVLSAAVAVGFSAVERRTTITSRVRRVYAVALCAVALAAVVAGLAAGGGPAHLAKRGWDSFTGSPVASTNLNSRLFNLSSNGRTQLWHVAWHEYLGHPVAGGGAGSFAAYWYQHRPSTQTVQDAHNLYLETLAELGVPGALLLVGLLLLPFAAIRARRQPLIPLAFAAYAALLVHAVYDWDWELPGVFLAGLVCGLAVLVANRDESRTAVVRARGRAVGLAAIGVCTAFAFVSLIGNISMSRSQNAFEGQHYAKALSNASRAADWAPWSGRPWFLLGQAQAGLGRNDVAVSDVRTAVRNDPTNYLYWLELSVVSHGSARIRAIERLQSLNPRFQP